MLHVSPHDLIQHQRASGRGECFVKGRDGKTVIDRLWQQGCAKLRLPKGANGDFEVVMINSSGGLTGGDRLNWAFTAAGDCTMTVTTQACEKIYASLGGPAEVHTEISVGTNAHINWLPQETILFNQAQLSRKLDVNLADDATALLVEPILLGRLAMDEMLKTGELRDQWTVRQNGQLIHAERFKLGPDVDKLRPQRAVLNGAHAFASVLMIDPLAEQFLESARSIIGPLGGASFWNGKLLARLIDEDGYKLRKRLMPFVSLLNKQAALPKCWSL